MAKYRLHEKRFIAGNLYSPGEKYLPEIEVPDDFPAGAGMEPLDAAAKSAVKKYEDRVGIVARPEPVVVKEIAVRPEMEPPVHQPFGPVAGRPDLLPKVTDNPKGHIRPLSDHIPERPTLVGKPGTTPPANMPPEKG